MVLNDRDGEPMNRRSTVLTTLILLAAAPVLVACGDDEGEPTPSPTVTSASPTPTETPEPTATPFDPAAVELVGTWRDDAADWTVHFAPDGTYTVDFQGNVDFLTGSYERSGSELRLVGLDGNTQVGSITEAGLVFDLGTLTRR